MPVVAELAHQLGLVPLVWLGSLRAGGRVVARQWWLVAGAFGASYLADWLGHRFPVTAVGPWYLVLQGGLLVWAVAPREHAARYLAVLAGTAAFVLLNFDPQTPDLLVHTVAWLGLLALAWPVTAWPLRGVLGVSFGLGWLAWVGLVVWRDWPSWYAYQSTRLLGTGLFCWASWKA